MPRAASVTKRQRCTVRENISINLAVHAVTDTELPVSGQSQFFLQDKIGEQFVLT